MATMSLIHLPQRTATRCHYPLPTPCRPMYSSMTVIVELCSSPSNIIVPSIPPPVHITGHGQCLSRTIACKRDSLPQPPILERHGANRSPSRSTLPIANQPYDRASCYAEIDRLDDSLPSQLQVKMRPQTHPVRPRGETIGLFRRLICFVLFMSLLGQKW
jgi:hypothetical protein